MRPVVLAAVLLGFACLPAAAQDAAEPVPSRCIAIAETLPKATYASFTPAFTPASTLAQAPAEAPATTT